MSRQPISRALPIVLLLAGFLLATAAPALAQRRPAAELLPENTVVYVRVPDVRQLLEGLQSTSLGEMVQDEEVAPLMEALYGVAYDELAKQQEQIGLSLDELLEIPQGEVCFALVPTPDADSPLTPILFIDTGDSTELVEILEGKALDRATERGVDQEEEETDQATIKVFSPNAGEGKTAYFGLDGTYVFSNDVDLLKSVLIRWNISPTRRDDVFSNNRNFVAIMERCKGTKENRPDLTFFVDPIGIFKAANSGVAGLGTVMIAQSIGVTDLQAIGGSYIFNVDGFESIQHFHVSIASPRRGVMKMLALQRGEITPPDFVPADTVTYMTLNWDIETTFDEFEVIFNKVQAQENALAEAIDDINEELDLDFREDILGNLTGRAVYMTHIVPPARINSQSTVVALGLEDSEALEEIFGGLIEREGSPEIEEKRVEGETLYLFPGPRQQAERARARAAEARERVRRESGQEIEEPRRREFPNEDRIRLPRPCCVFLDGWVLVSDSEEALELAVETYHGEGERLADDDDYLTIEDEIEDQTGSTKAGMITFTRPGPMLENFYELAQDQENQQRLRDAGEGNEVLGRISKVLDDHPLPSFEVLEKYMPTAGGVMTMDETGLHYFTFGLKHDE